MIKEKYIINDTLGFRVSACDVTGFFPSLLTIGKSGGRGSSFIVSVYAWELNIIIKYILLL